MAKGILHGLQKLKEQLEGAPQARLLAERARLFRAYVRAAVEDGAISDEEFRYLQKTAVDLGLPDSTGQQVLRDEVVDYLRSRLGSAHYNSPADAAHLVARIQTDLKHLRAKWKEVSSRLQPEILAYLGRVLDSLWRDSVVDEGELKTFKQVVQKFGLDYQAVCRTLASRTQAELEALLNIRFDEGEISQDVLEYVANASSALCLPAQSASRLHAMGLRLAQIAEVRRGRLPAVESPILLDGGEKCVFASHGARLVRNNTRVGQPPDVGTLVVSTRSLYFVPTNGGGAQCSAPQHRVSSP